jgi:hypothetical protein
LDLVNSRKLEFGAVREAFCALQAQGIPVTQLRLKVLFRWLPPIVATRYWKRYLGSERGEYTMARHARVAVDEMKELANIRPRSSIKSRILVCDYPVSLRLERTTHGSFWSMEVESIPEKRQRVSRTTYE